MVLLFNGRAHTFASSHRRADDGMMFDSARDFDTPLTPVGQPQRRPQLTSRMITALMP